MKRVSWAMIDLERSREVSDKVDWGWVFGNTDRVT